MRWDVFCKVIDNHGDVGVCWRLSTQLARRGDAVRLWIDDPTMLSWMAPGGEAGVSVSTWDAQTVGHAQPGDVVVEGFGCEIDPGFIAAMAGLQRTSGVQPVWINLEYLTAEPYALRCHGLPSPVQTGPGIGLVKYFYYPGFVPGTGGLLREPDLAARQARFDRAGWLRAQGVDWTGERLVSLFCYEPAALPGLLHQVARSGPRVRLLVTAGRAAAAVRSALTQAGAEAPVASQVHYLPWLAQEDFDHLLWSCDLNFVRGEDSLVRALWAGKPFVWQAYPQEGGAHADKLEAFLDWLQPAPAVRHWHQAWNGTGQAGLPTLDTLLHPRAVAPATAALWAQDDLATQLAAFVMQRRQTGR